MLSAVLSGLSGCDSAYLFSLAGEGESQKAFGAYEASATAGLVAASLLFSTAVGGDFDAAGFLTVLSYGAAMVLTFFLPEVPPPARRSAGFGTRAGEAAREVWDNRRFLAPSSRRPPCSRNRTRRSPSSSASSSMSARAFPPARWDTCSSR